MPVYIVFFIMGFVIVSSQRLQNRILQMRWVSLAGGAAGAGGIPYLDDNTVRMRRCSTI